MIRKSLFAFLVLVLGFALYAGWRLTLEAGRVMSDDPLVWEPVIEDLMSQPVPMDDPVLFIGSSSIRFWGDDLQSDLAEVGALGRGFGGAKINDISHYSAQLLAPFRPRALAIYIGANDISASFRAKAISNDEAEKRYRQMLATIKALVGKTPIYMIALKPTIRAHERWSVIQAFNKRLEQIATQDEQLQYIDANSGLWNKAGEPLSDALLFDGAHLRRQGYLIWGEAIKQRFLADGYSLP